MKAYFHIKSQHKLQSYAYTGNTINLQLSELDFVDIELEYDHFIEPDELKVFIGNTLLIVDEPIYKNETYFYRLNLHFLASLLPGRNESHLSPNRYDTRSEQRRFARIFINEIGISKVYVREQGTEKYIASILVETNKITTENYELITLYLISVGYFDSNIIYKAVIEGSQNDIKNTLLEALRELVTQLKKWELTLPHFKYDPISKYSSQQSIQPYSSSQVVDEDSIDWLVDNISVLKKTSKSNDDTDFVINNTPLKIDTILVAEYTRSSDTYENKIIAGFLLNLQRLITQLSEEISLSAPRTRITNFKEFLISCFKDLIAKTLRDADDLTKVIYSYFNKHIPVSTPLFGFPTKTEGFSKKPHYRDTLLLIDYTRRLFNIDLSLNTFSLEIESFDKLFEIYCFYVVRDSISNKLNYTNWQISAKAVTNNKLAGSYKADFGAFSITLFYEDLPPEFIQLSKTKYPYNPDFIIKMEGPRGSFYVILDAKYKIYDNEKLQSDLSRLTLNYLHKIGLADESSGKVIGLFTISLSSFNSVKLETIFKSDFSINGPAPKLVFPQIGNIEITPKNLRMELNPFLKILALLFLQSGADYPA